MEQGFGSVDFFRLLQQLRHIRWGAELKEMTQGEFMAVSAIYQSQLVNEGQPGIYVSVLAQELMISVSMASKLLKSLEERGWIRRTVDPERRRNTFVSLTESGRALYDEELQRCRDLHRRVQEKMGRDRMQRLLQDTEQLSRCFAEELGVG